VTKPLVLIDADVLGRRRTGDETYVSQLLRALPGVSEDLRIAAITRDPSLLPDGIEPVHLPVGSQELRMAVSVPRLLRRMRPELAHFVHALPLACPVPAVLTVQDLSWERDPSVFGHGGRRQEPCRHASLRGARRRRADRAGHTLVGHQLSTRGYKRPAGHGSTLPVAGFAFARGLAP
jgi:hypothetical protein